MKIFLDTANIDEIRKAAELGIIDGVTTNPSLVAKEGGDLKSLVKEICDIVNGPVSAEVVSTNAGGMIKEAMDLASIHENVVIKIPMIPEGIKAIKQLSQKGVKINCTLIFNPLQALLAAKAGATYVSPFVGRLDDIGHRGMKVVEDIVRIFENYKISTQIIVASIRHPQHFLEAALSGAHIATVPYKVLEQCFKHPLTDTGLERFLADWKKAQKK